MFKKTALTFGRCMQDSLRSRCIRSHHLAKIQEQFTADVNTKQGHLKVLANLKNKGIDQDQSFQRDGRPMPKTLEDGSVGVIHVQNESANLANPMVRRFLHDLEFQQAQRIEELEETKDDQDNVGSQTKQITMAAAGGNKDKDAKKKCEEEKLKKKCAELAQKEKCAKKAAAKKGGAKCGAKGGAKKDPCKKGDKKKDDMKKKCKEMAEKEKCKKMAEAEKKKAEEKKCKEMAEKEKCKKMAEKDKCKKPGNKGK